MRIYFFLIHTLIERVISRRSGTNVNDECAFGRLRSRSDTSKKFITWFEGDSLIYSSISTFDLNASNYYLLTSYTLDARNRVGKAFETGYDEVYLLG